jgi:hypothetical protein
VCVKAAVIQMDEAPKARPHSKAKPAAIRKTLSAKSVKRQRPR